MMIVVNCSMISMRKKLHCVDRMERKKETPRSFLAFLFFFCFVRETHGSPGTPCRHGVVDQKISEHRVAEGPADERCHHRVSQGRVPLSQPKVRKILDTTGGRRVGWSVINTDQYPGSSPGAPSGTPDPGQGPQRKGPGSRPGQVCAKG